MSKYFLHFPKGRPYSSQQSNMAVHVFNWMRICDAYRPYWPESSLLQVIACHLSSHCLKQPRYQSSWGQHGAHRGPVGPRWAPSWPINLAIRDCCVMTSWTPRTSVIFMSENSSLVVSLSTHREVVCWNNHWISNLGHYKNGQINDTYIPHLKSRSESRSTQEAIIRKYIVQRSTGLDAHFSNLFQYKNIERHTADTIVSWPNPKQWIIVHTSDLIMVIRQSYIFSQSSQEKWGNWIHTAPHIV